MPKGNTSRPYNKTERDALIKKKKVTYPNAGKNPQKEISDYRKEKEALRVAGKSQAEKNRRNPGKADKSGKKRVVTVQPGKKGSVHYIKAKK